MYPTLKSIGVGHFGVKIWEGGFGRCKPNFKATWERHEAKEIVSIFSPVSAQCTNVTNRQTDRPRNVTSVSPNNRRRRRHRSPEVVEVWYTSSTPWVKSDSGTEIVFLKIADIIVRGYVCPTLGKKLDEQGAVKVAGGAPLPRVL